MARALRPANYAARFQTRAFAPLPAQPKVEIAVERMGWDAWGGPKLAVMHAVGNEAALWRLLDLLRCPVEIEERRDGLCWWGYVATVEISVGVITIGVTIDDLANSVAVVYNLPRSSSGRTRTTSFLGDWDSQQEYGEKMLRLPLSDVSTVVAEQQQRAYLAAHRAPVSTWQYSGGRGDRDTCTATITCRGWMDTLHWKYAVTFAPTTQDTTAHIQAIAAVNPFLTGFDIVQPSGITETWESAGDTPVGEQVAHLLGLGTANNGRMLATVTPDRVLRIERAAPAPTAGDVRMDRSGALWNALDERLPAHTPIAGRWLGLKNVTEAHLTAHQLAQPAPFLVRSAELNVGQQRVLPEPWEQRRPWEQGGAR